MGQSPAVFGFLSAGLDIVPSEVEGPALPQFRQRSTAAVAPQFPAVLMQLAAVTTELGAVLPGVAAVAAEVALVALQVAAVLPEVLPSVAKGGSVVGGPSGPEIAAILPDLPVVADDLTTVAAQLAPVSGDLAVIATQLAPVATDFATIVSDFAGRLGGERACGDDRDGSAGDQRADGEHGCLQCGFFVEFGEESTRGPRAVTVQTKAFAGR